MTANLSVFFVGLVSFAWRENRYEFVLPKTSAFGISHHIPFLVTEKKDRRISSGTNDLVRKLGLQSGLGVEQEFESYIMNSIAFEFKDVTSQEIPNTAPVQDDIVIPHNFDSDLFEYPFSWVIDCQEVFSSSFNFELIDNFGMRNDFISCSGTIDKGQLFTCLFAWLPEGNLHRIHALDVNDPNNNVLFNKPIASVVKLNIEVETVVEAVDMEDETMDDGTPAEYYYLTLNDYFSTGSVRIPVPIRNGVGRVLIGNLDRFEPNRVSVYHLPIYNMMAENPILPGCKYSIGEPLSLTSAATESFTDRDIDFIFRFLKYPEDLLSNPPDNWLTCPPGRWG